MHCESDNNSSAIQIPLGILSPPTSQKQSQNVIDLSLKTSPMKPLSSASRQIHSLFTMKIKGVSEPPKPGRAEASSKKASLADSIAKQNYIEIRETTDECAGTFVKSDSASSSDGSEVEEQEQIVRPRLPNLNEMLKRARVMQEAQGEQSRLSVELSEDSSEEVSDEEER